MENIESLSNAELKKRIEEIEEKTEKLTKPKFSPIDKLTTIDDLLRENIIAQRDLTNITHKLLLAIYYKNGAEVSIQPNGVDTTAILAGLKGGDDYQTLNTLLQNISGTEAGILVEGSGIIETIKLVSNTATTDNKDYQIVVKCDKNILYNNTFAELEARTGTERGMVCYEDLLALKYILIFRTILYAERFEIKVLNSKAKFELLQVKYHKKV